MFKIVSGIIEGISVIWDVTLDLFFGKNEFEYLFKQIKLQNLDGHMPILRKTVEGSNYKAYLFTIPIGLSIEDFKDNKDTISQYLHKKECDVSIELVNNQALVTVKEENVDVSYNYEDYQFDSELRIPIGINLLTNKIVYWNFYKANETHLILGGTTGCGKSTMLNLIMSHIVNKLSDRVELYLQDTKIVDLYRYENTIPVKYYGENKDGIYDTLKELKDDMNERYKIIKKADTQDILEYNEKFKKKRMKYKFLVIEELGTFSKNDPDDSKSFYPELGELLRKGRAAGIQVIFTCQTPYNDTFPGIIKNNVCVIIGMMCITGEASKAVCGDYDALTKLKGEGHSKIFKRTGVEEVQGLNIQKTTVKQIVNRNRKEKDS